MMGPQLQLQMTFNLVLFEICAETFHYNLMYKKVNCHEAVNESSPESSPLLLWSLSLYLRLLLPLLGDCEARRISRRGPRRASEDGGRGRRTHLKAAPLPERILANYAEREREREFAEVVLSSRATPNFSRERRGVAPTNSVWKSPRRSESVWGPDEGAS